MHPSLHTSRFRIRHSECDSLQHLYTGSYIKLMQEATVQALLAQNCPLRKGEKAWIPAAAYLDMNKPIRMGDSINLSVELTNADDHEMSFKHVFQKTEEEEPASLGAVDWYLQAPEGPVSQHPSVQAEPSTSPSIPAPPELSTQPDGVVQHRVPIGWCDISQEQVVYNSRYMDTMVNAAMQAGNTYGWPWARLHNEGFVFVAKKQWLLYHASAGLSDEIEVTTWLADVRRSSALRQYLVHRVSDSLLLAEGHTLFVTISSETGRPVRIPEHFRQDFKPHISPDA